MFNKLTGLSKGPMRKAVALLLAAILLLSTVPANIIADRYYYGGDTAYQQDHTESYPTSGHSGLDPGRLGEQQPKVATSPESIPYDYETDEYDDYETDDEENEIEEDDGYEYTHVGDDAHIVPDEDTDYNNTTDIPEEHDCEEDCDCEEEGTQIDPNHPQGGYVGIEPLNVNVFPSFDPRSNPTFFSFPLTADTPVLGPLAGATVYITNLNNSFTIRSWHEDDLSFGPFNHSWWVYYSETSTGVGSGPAGVPPGPWNFSPPFGPEVELFGVAVRPLNRE